MFPKLIGLAYHGRLARVSATCRRHYNPTAKATNRLSDPALLRDYTLILPENFDSSSDSNELFKIPRSLDPLADLSNLDQEKIFKGFAQRLCDFERFTMQINELLMPPKKSFKEFMKDIDQELFPVETASNIYMLFRLLDSQGYSHKEFRDLMERYKLARHSLHWNMFKQCFEDYAKETYKNLKPVEKVLLRRFVRKSFASGSEKMVDETTRHADMINIIQGSAIFQDNLRKSNYDFKHTVDDPDILAAIASDQSVLQGNRELHHKERVPLQVTVANYQSFMRLCPDRFVRKLLWQTYNKRCSPKANPKLNNAVLIDTLRTARRRIAMASGYRQHLSAVLDNTMVESKLQILDTLSFLNEKNAQDLRDRLIELNEFASDDSMDDPAQTGIEEYDVEYYQHKYNYDIIMGIREPELRRFFPLPVVIEGLKSYSKNYLGIDIQDEPIDSKVLRFDGGSIWRLSRGGKDLGSILTDLHNRDAKSFKLPFCHRLILRDLDSGNLPLEYINASFERDESSDQVYLAINDIVNLFYTYGTALQNTLFNYEYTELNRESPLERDVTLFLPTLCVGHLFSDYRIIQACSDRGGSKPIDRELASRALKTLTHFRPLINWNDLYLSRLDIEAHSVNSDIRAIIKEIYPQYSPFDRDPNNYDYCASGEIFASPRSGLYYSNLLSKQLVNYCLTETMAKSGCDDINMASVSKDKIRSVNESIIDTLYDPANIDTKEKLASLFGSRFEPTQTGLGVF